VISGRWAAHGYLCNAFSLTEKPMGKAIRVRACLAVVHDNKILPKKSVEKALGITSSETFNQEVSL